MPKKNKNFSNFLKSIDIYAKPV